MCPSLCTSIYPSLVPTFSKTILPVDVCVSSNCTKKERQRERERERGGEGKKETRTVQLARAAIFPHAWKRRTTDSPDGVTSSVEFTHTNANAQRVTQRSTHTSRLTSRYTWRGLNIKHTSESNTHARSKLQNYRVTCSREMSSRKTRKRTEKKIQLKRWTNFSGKSDYIN